MTSSQVRTAVGVVRGLAFGETPVAGRYARIRLARDPGYFMDFDDPDRWESTMGRRVAIWYVEQLGSDGLTWRVVLDAREHR
jgi:hypothetical protein